MFTVDVKQQCNNVESTLVAHDDLFLSVWPFDRREITLSVIDAALKEISSQRD